MAVGQLRWVALVGAVVLLAGNGGQARGGPRVRAPLDDDGQLKLTGVINDHTTAVLGSWEIHGVWTLRVKQYTGTADLTAALTMERADYWFVSNPAADPNSIASRSAHTHHVSMNDALVTALQNGFRISGPATLTGNGATPPFGTSSTAQVDVTGGDLVTYSNIALTFGGDAAKHFGTNPIAGVVKSGPGADADR
jgi:hypothetical protein